MAGPNTVEVTTVSNWGRRDSYVTNKRQRAALQALTGRSTLQRHHIEALRVLGVKVKEKEAVQRPDHENEEDA